MNRNVVIGIIVAIVIVVGVVLAVMKHPAATNTASSTTPAPTTAPATSSSSSSSSTGAGNVAITGGTNGPSCDSGGYFKPSSVTIKSGETITFSVPSNDPYSGGLQINGLPGGSIVVARGGSMTTSPITATVNFNATWPNETACKKGSGTITVT